MTQRSFPTEVAARTFGDDVDAYGWVIALRLLSAGVRPLADGDVTELGILRARIAASAAGDWNRMGSRAVMRNDLAVTVDWATADQDNLMGIPDIDPRVTTLRVLWNGVPIDEVELASDRLLPYPRIWGKWRVVTTWQYEASKFFSRLIGITHFDEVFADSGIKVWKRIRG